LVTGDRLLLIALDIYIIPVSIAVADSAFARRAGTDEYYGGKKN